MAYGVARRRAEFLPSSQMSIDISGQRLAHDKQNDEYDKRHRCTRRRAAAQELRDRSVAIEEYQHRGAGGRSQG